MKNLITSLSFFVILSSLSIGYSQVVVSATRMNVLYRGIENPLDIAVSGWDNKDLSISVSDDHKLTHQEDGSFIITPSGNSRQATISVEGKMPDGSISNLGSAEFRIKSIPAPIPFWSGCSPSKLVIKRAQLLSFATVVAKMSDDFMFPVKTLVESFRLTISSDWGVVSITNNGRNLNSSMKFYLNHVKPGDFIVFDQIVVSIPGDQTVILSELQLSVNSESDQMIEQYKSSLDEAGHIINDVQDGLINFSNEDGSTIYDFKNGALVSSKHFNIEDSLTTESLHDDWFIIETKVFRGNGILKYKGTFKSDLVFIEKHSEYGDFLGCLNEHNVEGDCNRNGVESEQCFDEKGVIFMTNHSGCSLHAAHTYRW